MPRRLSYDDPIVEAIPLAEHDPFGAELLAILDANQSVATEATWEQFARVIARRWRSFTVHQSPLSTMQMMQRCAQTVVQIRLASRRTGGEEEARQLEEFQELMRAIFAEGEGGGGVEAEEAEEDAGDDAEC